MKDLVNQSKIALKSIGKIFYGPTKNEKNMLLQKINLYFKRRKKRTKITDKI